MFVTSSLRPCCFLYLRFFPPFSSGCALLLTLTQLDQVLTPLRPFRNFRNRWHIWAVSSWCSLNALFFVPAISMTQPHYIIKGVCVCVCFPWKADLMSFYLCVPKADTHEAIETCFLQWMELKQLTRSMVGILLSAIPTGIFLVAGQQEE